jgi:hypothetical protein
MSIDDLPTVEEMRPHSQKIYALVLLDSSEHPDQPPVEHIWTLHRTRIGAATSGRRYVEEVATSSPGGCQIVDLGQLKWRIDEVEVEE